MKSSNPPLPMGFSLVPPGKIASAVTCLEMREKTYGVGRPLGDGLTLARVVAPNLDSYRSLFRLIGQNWLWSSRLERSDEALRATLEHPLVEIYVLSKGEEPAGLLELDFREANACELVLLGVVPELVGKGLGSILMDQALAIAWSRPISRFWLHTCHLDHPGALAFYQRFGLKPISRWVEVFDDPRLTGVLPVTAAPHVPTIRENEA